MHSPISIWGKNRAYRRFRSPLAGVYGSEKKTTCPNYSAAVHLFQVPDFASITPGLLPSLPARSTFGTSLTQLEFHTLHAPKPHHSGLRSSARVGIWPVYILAKCRAQLGLSQSMARGSQEQHWSCQSPNFKDPVTRNPPPWYADTASRGRFERLSAASSLGHFPGDCWRPVAAHRMPGLGRRFDRHRRYRAREQ